MSQQTINIGAAPNDGTGDPIRSAMNKVNLNFNEVYSGFAFSTSTNNVTVANTIFVPNFVSVGNSTSNVYVGYVNTATLSASFQAYQSQNNFVQGLIQNFSSGSSASADLAAYNGETSQNTYVDIGINGASWSNTLWTINGPNDGYLYTGNASNLSVGTSAVGGYLSFFTGGTLAANERARITSTGNVGINNTAPVHTLSVNGTGYFGANLYVNTISTPAGSSANLVIDPDGTADLIITNQTEVFIQSNYYSTSVATGALVVNGGIGIANTSYFGNNLFVNNTVNAASYIVGTNFVANSTTILSGNTTGNLVITPYNISINANGAGGITFVGNSTVNAYVSTLTAYFGNTTGNTVINPTSVTVQNSTVNSTMSIGSVLVQNSSVNSIFSIGSIVVQNTSVNSVLGIGSVTFGNTTTGTGGSLANTTTIFVGNNTVNTLLTSAGLNVNAATIANSSGVYTTGTVNAASHTVGTNFIANTTSVQVSNTTGNIVITPISVIVANASVNNFIANTTAVTIAANTLTLGTSTKAANGYTYLPNGMKMNWGSFICNTVSQVTFTSAFATALVSLTVTPNGPYYVGANTPYVFASNTSTANIYSVSTTTTNTVYYVAIGY